MAGPDPGQELQPELFKPLGIEQLFTADLDSEQSHLPLDSIVMAGSTWVKLGREGISVSEAGPAVGEENEAVQAGRRLLVGALCTYGSFEPFNVADALIGQALKNLEEAESSSLGHLRPRSMVAFARAEERIVALQESYREGVTESLERAIIDDPDGLLVSVVDERFRYSSGRQGLSGFGILLNLAFEGVKPKTKQPIVKPVLLAGEPGTLPEGQAVKALFAKAA